MTFRIAGMVLNSTVDGPGVRLAVFFQGCIHHCPGCQNPQTWQILGGEKTDTEVVKKLMAQDPMLSGVTLTGGDPFLQPKAALELAKYAHFKGLNVWCYTGYTWEWIESWDDNRKELLKETDVLVDGRFEREHKTLDLPWVGSSNQRVIDVKKSLAKSEIVLWEEG